MTIHEHRVSNGDEEKYEGYGDSDLLSRVQTMFNWRFLCCLKKERLRTINKISFIMKFVSIVSYRVALIIKVSSDYYLGHGYSNFLFQYPHLKKFSDFSGAQTLDFRLVSSHWRSSAVRWEPFGSPDSGPWSALSVPLI